MTWQICSQLNNAKDFFRCQWRHNAVTKRQPMMDLHNSGLSFIRTWRHKAVTKRQPLVEGCKDIAVLEGPMQELARARRVSQVEARVKASSGMGYRGEAEHLSLNQPFAYKTEGETCP